MKVLVVTLIASLVGCASASQRTEAGAAPQPGSAQHRGYGQVLAATDIDGQSVGAPDPETRATLVVFFASWCNPCRHELAILGDLRRRDRELRVVGINAYEDWSDLSDRQKLRSFLAEHAPWLQVVHATDPLMQSFGGVPKIPTMFVFASDGTLVAEFRRDRRAPPTREEVAAAVARAKGAGHGPPQARR